jgi:hypothetical protein
MKNDTRMKNPKNQMRRIGDEKRGGEEKETETAKESEEKMTGGLEMTLRTTPQEDRQVTNQMIIQGKTEENKGEDRQVGNQTDNPTGVQKNHRTGRRTMTGGKDEEEMMMNHHGNRREDHQGGKEADEREKPETNRQITPER